MHSFQVTPLKTPVVKANRISLIRGKFIVLKQVVEGSSEENTVCDSVCALSLHCSSTLKENLSYFKIITLKMSPYSNGLII